MKKGSSKKRTPPFSVRLSDQERAELECRAAAAGLTLGGYWKSAVFNLPPPRKSRRPQVDRVELARLLGAIGRLGNNVNQISRALNAGSSIEISEISQAFNDLSDMRGALMVALGYEETSQDKTHDKDEHPHDY